MKAKFEFNLPEEEGQYQVYKNSYDMFISLCDLRDLSRCLYKGYEDPNIDNIIDKLNDILVDSKIDEIP